MKLFYLFTVLLCVSCSVKKGSKAYKAILLNSGYIANDDSIRILAQQEFSIYNFNPGEKIADIGCGSGWFEAYLMLAYDSLEIYAEDIDRRQIRNIDVVVNAYTEKRKSHQTNTIQYVLGNYQSTNLPQNYFDKIIIRETFHHFSKKDEMLADIKSKLKSKGQIYVYEPFVEESSYNEMCKATILNEEAVVRIFNDAGFGLQAKHQLNGNPGNVPPWYTKNIEPEPKIILVFTKN
ncbi:MAG: class I SAM-dependent methyltransferase [Bacteroidia bacterium]